MTLPVDPGLYGTFLGTIALICVIPGPDIFLPQFVDRHNGQVTWQFVILGASFTAVGLIVDLAIGIGSGRLGRRLVRSPKLAPALGRITSVVSSGSRLVSPPSTDRPPLPSRRGAAGLTV